MKWAVVLIVMSVFQQSSWADDRVSIDRLKHPGGSLAALGLTLPKEWSTERIAVVANRLNLAIETRNEALLTSSEHDVLLEVLEVARMRCQALDPGLDIHRVHLEAKPFNMVSSVDEDLPFVSPLLSGLERMNAAIRSKDEKLRSRALSVAGFCAGMVSSCYFFSSPIDSESLASMSEKATISAALGIGAGVVSYCLGGYCQTLDLDRFSTSMGRSSLVFDSLHCAGEKSEIAQELIHQARVRGSLRSVGPDFIDLSELGEVRCPICMEDYEIDKSVAINENCHNCFCVACWMRLFIRGPNSCPLCRDPARANDYQIRVISGPELRL